MRVFNTKFNQISRLLHLYCCLTHLKKFKQYKNNINKKKYKETNKNFMNVSASFSFTDGYTSSNTSFDNYTDTQVSRS